MDKIFEALSKLLPEDQVKEVSEAIKAMLDDAKKDIEAEANKNLEDAYAELSQQLETEKKTAEAGYQEAYTIISDLRNRLETQKTEFEAAQNEGYEEAYQMLKAEQAKTQNLEVDMYEQFDTKLAQMKEYIVDKLDQFLSQKGKEIYENARRDVLNDPRQVEHKVTLDRIVDTVANYISDEDYTLATTSKLEEATKAAQELKGQIRILEARNIRLSTENNKLNESLRHKETVLTETTKTVEKTEKKERIEKAKNVQGRGHIAEGVIPEHVAQENKADGKDAMDEATMQEYANYAVLAGLRKAD